MENSTYSNRKYPVKLIAKFDTMSGQGIAQEKIVNSDAEYNSFYTRYTRERNASVEEVKMDSVIEQETLEKMQQARVDELNFKKLKIDLANAERVYKTYRSTQIIAWIAAFIGILVFYIQLSQIFKWWPYIHRLP